MVEKHAIGQRAVDLYLAKVGEDRRNWVTVSVPLRHPRPLGDGWHHISNVTDRLAEVYHYVEWHAESGDVRLGPQRV